jgi:class 3 adenylate cyclase/predicted ATPase
MPEDERRNDTMDIGGWLRGLGLERYEQAFRDNEIDLRVLPELTADDLKELGVAAIGHRRLLLKAIADLAAGAGRAMAEDVPAASLANATIEAERRQLTVMFCDLVGSTPLSTRFDPEDLREIVGAYHRCVADTVGRFGGFVAKYMGDGVLIYFGYPEAHEDDAERAARAGLAVIDAVGRLATQEPLNVRIGIATGLVVVGDLIGAGAAQERGVVGETPNLAARLQALARPGTLVVADSTRRQIGTLFEIEDLGPQPLAGFAEPQPAWRVVGESGVVSRFEALRSGITPLVGRDEELGLLLRRWQQAKLAEGRLVLVSGEPGIGKSRLTAALSQHIETEPHTRIRYFCSPHDQDSALYPFIGQLERAAGFTRDDTTATKLDKLEALLGDGAEPGDISLIAEMLSLAGGERFPPLDLSPQRKKERTLAALLRQLQALVRRQPVLMIFEDLHWIDPTSRELLDLTVEKITDLPVLMVATHRPEFQPPWVGQSQVTVIALNRLRRSEGATLVARLAGNLGALPSDVVDEIVERTDGVPLFVEELTKAVVEAGADRGNVPISAVPPSVLAVPATLHASLLGRLDRLGPSAKNVAQVGAAIGRDFSHELLAAAVPLAEPELQEALSRLVEAGLVFQRGVPPAAEYLFKHALVRDTAYSTLLRGPRQALHHRIAEALEQRFPDFVATRPELFAQHYAEAGLVEKSAVYWGKAGRRSATRSAMAEAAMQFEKALDQLALLPDTPERQRQELDLQSSLGSVRLATRGLAAPQTGQSYGRARELWEQLDYPSELLRVPWGQWLYYTNRGDLNLGHRLAEDLLRLSKERGDSAGRILGHLCVGGIFMIRGEFSSSLSHLEKVRQLYRPDQHELFANQAGMNPLVLALEFLGLVLACLGYIDKAVALGHEAIEEAQRLQHRPSLASALAVKTRVAAFLRDRRFVEYADWLCSLGEEQAFPFWRHQGLIYRGWARIKNGEIDGGLLLLRDSAGAYRATGAEIWTPFHHAMEAEGEALRDRAGVALSILDSTLQSSRARSEGWFEAELVRLRGELLGTSDLETSEILFHEAIDIACRQQAKFWELRAATSLALLWREQGRRAEARDLLAPVYGWFTEGFDTADLKEAKALLDELT